MKEYLVFLTLSSHAFISVEAASEDEAIDKVKHAYYAGELADDIAEHEYIECDIDLSYEQEE